MWLEDADFLEASPQDVDGANGACQFECLVWTHDVLVAERRRSASPLAPVPCYFRHNIAVACAAAAATTTTTTTTTTISTTTTRDRPSRNMSKSLHM